MAHLVDTAESARELAADLLRTDRARPAIVVSIAGGRTDPFVDVVRLEGELDGLCDVYVLPTGSASWAFAEALPEGRQVFGGASRVYATDLAWVRDQYASPLRFAYNTWDGRQVTELLVADAFAAVYRERQQSPRRPSGRVERVGTVRGVAGGRALVHLDSGGGLLPATIHPELVAPGVAAERLFVKGQRVGGLYDAEANRLDVEPQGLPAREAFSDVEPSDVLLARVAKVGTKYVTVTLRPGVDVRVPIDESEDDDLGAGHLFTVDEVLPVEVDEVAGGLPSHVTVLPPNFADLARSVPILPGGPPWLTAEQVGPPLGSALSGAAPDVPGAGSSPGPGDEAPDDEPPIDPADPAAPLLAEIAGLRRRLRATEREVETLKQRVAAAKTATRTAKQELRTTRDQLAAARSNRPDVGANLFADPADQFRHEVYVAWAERTTAQDKQDRPWRVPSIGPDFIASLDTTEGVDRAKVVEVAVDIVTGHAEHLAGRELHQLRRGAGANDPAVVREGGATCWRIYLQHKTPSARRLHFWRLTDGSIELSSVRLHDDLRP